MHRRLSIDKFYKEEHFTCKFGQESFTALSKKNQGQERKMTNYEAIDNQSETMHDTIILFEMKTYSYINLKMKTFPIKRAGLTPAFQYYKTQTN